MKLRHVRWSLVLGLALIQAAVLCAAQLPRLTTQDYLDIQQLAESYPYKIDACTSRGYDYADQYVPDGVFGVSSAWGSAGKIWYRGREQLADAGGGGNGGCRPKAAGAGVHHIQTNLVIIPTESGAVGKSTLLSLGRGDGVRPPRIEWQGGYEDVYVKTPAGWRFKSRLHVWPDHDWPDSAAQQAALRSAAQAKDKKIK